MISERWRALKAAARQRSGGRCEDCRCKLGKEAHLHHLTYERRGHELLADVRLICLPCHGHRHPRHTFLTMEEQARRARLRKLGRRPARPQPPAVVEAHWDEINGRFAEAIATKEPYVRLAVKQAMNRATTRKAREAWKALERAQRKR